MYINIPGAADQHKMDIVFYELRMVNALSGLIGRQNSTALNNATLESFLIHVRALKDFFEGNGGRSDDLICSDFKDKAGLASSPQILALDKYFKETLDKSVAHMTTRRLLHKPEWDPLLIRLEINRAAFAFLSACREDEFPISRRNDYLADFEQMYGGKEPYVF